MEQDMLKRPTKRNQVRRRNVLAYHLLVTNGWTRPLITGKAPTVFFFWLVEKKYRRKGYGKGRFGFSFWLSFSLGRTECTVPLVLTAVSLLERDAHANHCPSEIAYLRISTQQQPGSQ